MGEAKITLTQPGYGNFITYLYYGLNPPDSSKTSCNLFTQNDYNTYKEYLSNSVFYIANVQVQPGHTFSGQTFPIGYIDRLQKFLTEISQNSIDSNQTISAVEYPGINTALEDFEAQKLKFNLAAQCQAEQATLDLKDYNDAKDVAEESKLRLDGIRNSDTQVSYYEGWFPLFRPMSETALFGLFSVSIAILLASIVMYLRMQGIELQILMPASSIGFMAIFDTLRQYSSYIWFAIAAGLAIGFAAYKMEWV
jgi:hypothetical protein